MRDLLLTTKEVDEKGVKVFGVERYRVDALDCCCSIRGCGLGYEVIVGVGGMSKRRGGEGGRAFALKKV